MIRVSHTCDAGAAVCAVRSATGLSLSLDLYFQESHQISSGFAIFTPGTDRNGSFFHDVDRDIKFGDGDSV